MQKIKIGVFVLCLFISYAVAGIGSLFTLPEVQSSWYQSVKPSITPPNEVFSIVWNILFFLIACSLYFAWHSAEHREDRKRVVCVYAINFVAMTFWSILFFALREPLWAFVDIFVIASSIVSIMLATWDDDHRPTWFLIPYLAWIAYAGVLNWMS